MAEAEGASSIPAEVASVAEVADEGVEAEADGAAEVASVAEVAEEGEEPSRKRRRGVETQQTVLLVNGPKVINGKYAQLSAPRPMWRKIDDGGEWADVYLYFDEGHWRFRPEVETGNTKCWARGTGDDTSPELCTWQVKREKVWEERAIRIVKLDHSHLSPAARRTAKQAWRDMVTPLRCRCTAKGICPVPNLRDWGVENEADLYAHVCMYHWGSVQYRDLHEKLWQQDVYEWQAAQKEDKSDLLQKFQAFMCKNKYDTQKTRGHVRRIEYDAWKLDRDLSRDLAFDIEALHTIAEWPEDVTAKGHYTVSFRWFRKFVESDAVAAAALFPGPEPVARVESAEPLPWAAKRARMQEGASSSGGCPGARTANQGEHVEAAREVDPLQADKDQTSRAAFAWRGAGGAGAAHKADSAKTVEVAAMQAARVAARSSHDAEAWSCSNEHTPAESPSSRRGTGMFEKVARAPEPCQAARVAASSSHDAEAWSCSNEHTPAESPSSRRVTGMFEKVARAPEPCQAVAEAMAASSFIDVPSSTAQKAGPSTKTNHMTPSTKSLEAEAAVASPLSSAWAQLLPRGEDDASDRARAQRVAAKHEREAKRLLSSSTDAQIEEEQVWLWVFAGLGEASREEVATGLVQRALGRSPLAWADLMVRLLCCAWSPYAPAADLLPAVRTLAEGASLVRLDLASVLGLARRAFQRPRDGVAVLKKESTLALLKWATFGSLMSEPFAKDAGFLTRTSPAFTNLLNHHQTASTLTKTCWCALSCFLCAFLWRMDPEEAARLTAAPPAARIPAPLWQDLLKLQLHARKAAAAANQKLQTPPKAASLEASILARIESVLSEAEVLKAVGKSHSVGAVLEAIERLLARGVLFQGAEPGTYTRKRKAPEKPEVREEATPATSSICPPPEVREEATPATSSIYPPPEVRDEAPPATSSTLPPPEVREEAPPATSSIIPPPEGRDPGPLEAPWNEASQRQGPVPSQVPALARLEDRQPPTVDARAVEQNVGPHARLSPPPTPPAAQPTPAATRQTQIPVILAKNINTSHGQLVAVEGVVHSRLDYKKGSPPGFQVRLKDSSGFIDAKFWDVAADRFRAVPALARGARVRLEGFYIYQIQEKDMQYAAPGRRFELRANQNSKQAKVITLEEARKPITLADLHRVAEHQEVVLDAHVHKVGDLEDKLCQVPGGGSAQPVPFRRNVLTAPGLSFEWHLFRENAERWGAKLKGMRILIHGTRVRVLGVKRIVSGGRNVEIL